MIKIYKELISTLIREWMEKIPPEDLIFRELNIDIRELFKLPKKIIAIVGLRRVGKSYTIFQLISMLKAEYPDKKAVYINFEDERVPEEKEILNSLIATIMSEFDGLSNIYLFLDEIHRIPEWSRWLRRIYDMEKPNIIITGSTSKLTSFSLPSELRGRSLTLRVFPLRFWEFLKFKGANIDFKHVKYSDSEKSKLMKFFEEFLEFGGLPEVVMSPRSRKLMTLQDYFNAIILRDIIEVKGDIRDISKVINLIKMFVNTVYFSATKIERAMESAGFKISRDNILEYKELAINTFFIEELEQLSDSFKKKLIAPSKLYVGDNGFLTALSRKKVKKGRLLENLVYIELLRRYFGDPSIEINYYNGKYGEVDFVVRDGFDVIELIQVCWDPTDFEVKEREVKSLLNIMRVLNIKKAKIITGYYEGREKFGNREIFFEPYWVWELSGRKSVHVL